MLAGLKNSRKAIHVATCIGFGVIIGIVVKIVILIQQL